MATMDTIVAHIMDQQEDFKIKSSKCWDPIRPPATLLTSNDHRIYIRHPFRPIQPQFRIPYRFAAIKETRCSVTNSGPRGMNKVDLHRQDQQPMERCIDR
uniref:Retrotransposon, putative, centromere-specific n=1 Tax=Oryza sativa subsp. japonica TaxID=39947 RepID=Q84ZG3_ORYSJ|nr:hypothetical protein [Oryza sativa Japonica Group]